MRIRSAVHHLAERAPHIVGRALHRAMLPLTTAPLGTSIASQETGRIGSQPMTSHSSPLATLVQSVIERISPRHRPSGPLLPRGSRREAGRIRHRVTGASFWTRADRHPNPRKPVKRVVNDLGGIYGDSNLTDHWGLKATRNDMLKPDLRKALLTRRIDDEQRHDSRLVWRGRFSALLGRGRRVREGNHERIPVALALAVAAALLAGCTAGGATARPVPTPYSTAAGSGLYSGPYFRVPTDGAVAIDYTASGTCSLAFRLYQDPSGFLDTPTAPVGGAAITGTWVLSIPAGRYALYGGGAGCTWSVLVRPN